jgi:hypothetical protein
VPFRAAAGRGSQTMPPAAVLTVVDQARDGIGPAPATAASSRHAAGSTPAPPAVLASKRHASVPLPWLAPVPAAAVSTLDGSSGARASSRAAGARPASSAATRGGGVVSPQSPFGPPGRGAVGGGSGASGGTAGSTTTCAILVGLLLLLSISPLRRFRPLPVAAGPVGFAALQQRPG